MSEMAVCIQEAQFNTFKIALQEYVANSMNSKKRLSFSLSFLSFFSFPSTLP